MQLEGLATCGGTEQQMSDANPRANGANTTLSLLPLSLTVSPSPNFSRPWLFGDAEYQFRLHSGLTILLGPNASGKTQVLRDIQRHLDGVLTGTATGKRVRFVAAGRLAPFEPYRSLSANPHGLPTDPAAVGSYSDRRHRLVIEGLVGDIMALEERADLRIKVEARLEVLFGCRLRLLWTQGGLELTFLTGRGAHPANCAASGLLHLVGLLAAMHDDQVGALIVDEPEISFHPQMQAFLLEEFRGAAGDPLADPGKKLIVLATHAPAMLPLHRITDLPNLVFFTDQHTLPRQVAPDAGELQNKKLGALVARLGATQRATLFAPTVLLVEGPSDQTIVTALAARVGRSLARAGVEVVPVVGKGEIPGAVKLFRLMNKRLVVLADLDALADANDLVNAFAQEAEPAAVKRGHGGVVAMDRSLRTEFAQAVEHGWHELEPLAASHRYMVKPDKADTTLEKARRRAALAAILREDQKPLEALPSAASWLSLRGRFVALLDVLETGGCFILRRGTIEDCYADPPPPESSGKPEAADQEAALLADAALVGVHQRYADALRAISSAAPGSPVDERAFLREQLAMLLAATFSRLDAGTTAEDLRRIMAGNQMTGTNIFTVENVSSPEPNGRLALRVGLASSLFIAPGLPTDVGREESLIAAVDRLLPRAQHDG